jgi:hypothetical protein
MSAIATPRLDLPRAELVLLPVAPAVPAQRILSVEFRSSDGRAWNAIGGGDTLAAAIEWARESCPHGTTWEPVGWEDIYGE